MQPVQPGVCAKTIPITAASSICPQTTCRAALGFTLCTSGSYRPGQTQLFSTTTLRCTETPPTATHSTCIKTVTPAPRLLEPSSISLTNLCTSRRRRSSPKSWCLIFQAPLYNCTPTWTLYQCQPRPCSLPLNRNLEAMIPVEALACKGSKRTASEQPEKFSSGAP